MISGHLELQDIEPYMKRNNTKTIEVDVDIRDEEDIPDWFCDLTFNKDLVVPPQGNLNNLPRDMSNTRLFIGGKDFYTLSCTRLDLFGLPKNIKNLHIQAAIKSTKGLFGVVIHNTFAFSVKKIIDFEELPTLIKTPDEDFSGKRVNIFGMEFPSITAKKFWKYHTDYDQDWHNIEMQIADACFKDFSEQVLDAI